MSPIEYIAEGIRTGNWDLVCEGYERLTGEALHTPSAKAFITKLTIQDAENALRQVADMLSNILMERKDFLLTKQNPTTEPKKVSKKKVGCPKGSRKKSVEKNTVDEDGEDSSLRLDVKNRNVVQKQAGGTQLITNEPNPEEVERNRERAEKAQLNKVKIKRRKDTMYDVKCNECEETFQSSRAQGKVGQKCRKCLNDKKSRFV